MIITSLKTSAEISAATTLAALQQPEDALVLHNDQNWPVAAYHLGGRDWIGLQSGRPMDSEDAAGHFLEPAWDTHAGLWLLVTPEALNNDPDHRVYQWLAARAVAMREYRGDPDNRLYFFARTPERAATADALRPQAIKAPTLSLSPAPGLTLARAEWEHLSRILADVISMFGLPFPTVPPRLALRATIRLFVALPHEWTLPLVGASEVVGCILFRAMRDEGMRLFADDPAVADRIGRLYDAILADEVGHVGFIAAKLSPRWRSFTRFLAREVAWRSIVGSVPELVVLLDAPDWRYLAYHLGGPIVQRVVVAGELR
jgi:hypothetical protein